jgi:thiamine pyrophosphate-dependent acetolactate synthase large subunit-like protein
MDGGHRIARAIAKQKVPFVFTLCGGHISPILSGCKKEGVRVIDVRHEVNAVFAADAVARLSGIPGVAAVTAGPGLTNTITALKNASMAQSPLVLLGGAAPTVLKGRGALQDIDQMALMRPLVKWTASVKQVHKVEAIIEEAFYRAMEGVPGPVFVECPIDTLYDSQLVRSWYIGAAGKKPKTLGQKALNTYLNWHLNRVFKKHDQIPETQEIQNVPHPSHHPSDVNDVAKALSKAERPVFIIGSQSMLQAHKADQIAEAVKTLGVPCYLSGMARGLLGAEHPLLQRHKRRLALKDADLVLLAGVPCDFRLDYGRHIPGRAKYISINRSKEDLRKNRKPNIGVLADPGNFLIDLSAQVKAKDRQAWLDQLESRSQEREADVDRQAQENLGAINPVQLFRSLDPMLDEKSILVADGGDFVGTASYILKARNPLSWLDPGAFGTLGVGAGFALGAKLCFPEAETWIIWGDGSSAYSLAEMDTFARHGLGVIGLIGNDACWAQIARDQVEILQDDVAVMLEHSNYDQVGIGYGGLGRRVENLNDFQASVAQAKEAAASGKPYVINAIIGRSDFRKGSISM